MRDPFWVRVQYRKLPRASATPRLLAVFDVAPDDRGKTRQRAVTKPAARACCLRMPAIWTTRSDGELLRCARSDPDAFAELYRRYEPIVIAFLARRTRDREQTADLMADTFAIALLNASRFRDTGDPAVGWLLGIARNQQLEAWRRTQTADRALQRLGVERPVLTDASIERIGELSAGRLTDQLERALARLPPGQRSAVEAVVVHDKPYADLAEHLGVPEATVRQRVSRGLARLRSTLEGTR